jgi:RNA polymerase sigma-70 factor (ECF subfamily)
MSADKQSFERLYDAHWLEIKKFIFVNARRNVDATDEIFQNTWENAFRYFDTLNDKYLARAWLYSIARNETSRYFDKNREHFATLSFDAEGANGSPLIDEPVDEEESAFPEAFSDSELVKQLLNCLSEDEQRLIILHFVYDQRLKEIALNTNSNYNTVKSIMRRALAKMRTEYERTAGEYDE